jgi:hypothetical protein
VRRHIALMRELTLLRWAKLSRGGRAAFLFADESRRFMPQETFVFLECPFYRHYPWLAGASAPGCCGGDRGYRGAACSEKGLSGAGGGRATTKA